MGLVFYSTARYTPSHMLIGCHVSIVGGVHNAPDNAAALGCEVFQMFSRSPQGGPAPKLLSAADLLAEIPAEVVGEAPDPVVPSVFANTHCFVLQFGCGGSSNVKEPD